MSTQEKAILADFLALAEEKETNEFKSDNGTYTKFEEGKLYTMGLMRERVMLPSKQEGEPDYEAVQFQMRDESGITNLHVNADTVMMSYHEKLFSKQEAEGKNCAIIRVVSKGEQKSSSGNKYADLRFYFLSFLNV